MAAYTSIDNPELYFQVKTYTGNGSTRSITLDGDEDMQPDIVWFKNRSGDAGSHTFFDSVRGAQKRLNTDSTNAEATLTTGLSSFDSDGFSIGADGDWNTDSVTHVAWCWKESADAGLDIVGYTGNGSNRTISHSLSAVPNVIIVKSRSGVYGWQIYHHKNTSAPETDYLEFKTDATQDEATSWNDTAPTSSVFSIGTTDALNEDGNTHIAYLFAPKQGFSKFGSYTGNGNADGNFIFLGFKPAFILLKGSSNTENWSMYDNKRLGYNVDNNVLYPNTSSTEGTSDDIDFLSNGFKIRRQTGLLNDSGNTYIYLAFAEAPFVNSKGVPCNAR